MPQHLREIRDSITSTDVAVLRQALAFVQERMKEEQDRGKVSETRATAIIAILGIFSGLIIPFAITFEATAQDNYTILYIVIGASVLFLLKGIYYAFKILGISKQYRLKPDYIQEIQTGTIVEALRTDIAASIWLYEQVKYPNTRKLFWLDRAQRNGLIAIFLFAFFGISLFVSQFHSFLFPLCVTYGLATFFVLAWLLSDVLAEWFGGIWSRT